MLTMFSSRTGSDCIHICEELKLGNVEGHSLDDVSKIVTNKVDSPLFKYCYDNGINCVLIPNRPSLVNYEELGISDTDLILLNGWLRIVPGEWISDHPHIYNLHPGLITKYPELKGLDPQKRAWEGRDKYTDIGCVIHKVIPEVDEGEVVLEVSTDFDHLFLDDVFTELGLMSKEMWVEFLSQIKW